MTEPSPPAVADVVPSSAEEDEDRIAALKARLTERGLLRTARPSALVDETEGNGVPARLSVDDLKLESVGRRPRPLPTRPAAGRQGRRWLAAGVVVVLLLLVVAAGVLSGGSSPEGRSRAACARYDRVRTGVTNGVLTGPALASSLADVRDEAKGGVPAVSDAATQLAEAGDPGSAAFLLASTVLADACDAL